MGSKNYNREISLLCPACGESQFIYNLEAEKGNVVFKCCCCEQVYNRDELLKENGEIIDEIVFEMEKEIVKDAAEELRKALKKGLK